MDSVLKSLLADCCVPFLEALQHWVLQGELRDPFNEFLVAANEGVSDDELWQRGYRSHTFLLGKLSLRGQAHLYLYLILDRESSE